MQSKRKIRNTSLQNRKLEHRKNHPNDRLSFGEKRVPKIRNKINLKTNIEEIILGDIKSSKTNKQKISSEIPEKFYVQNDGTMQGLWNCYESSSSSHR